MIGNIFKGTLLAFFALVVIYGLGFLATGGNLAIYKYWQPQIEDARRNVFENTQSYVHGKNTYIERLRLQYETSNGPEKESLRRLILEEASTIDPSNLTASNRSFIGSLRNNF